MILNIGSLEASVSSIQDKSTVLMNLNKYIHSLTAKPVKINISVTPQYPSCSFGVSSPTLPLCMAPADLFPDTVVSICLF